MTPTVIYERNGWRLTSYSNGAAYLLEDRALHRSVFFQYGDDASAFRKRCLTADGWLSDQCERTFAEYEQVMR